MIDKTAVNEKQAITCIYCKSNKVIKHGKTSTGNKRYRCRNCGKTWVLEKNEIDRPELSLIVEEYLDGKTCRELVDVYHSSPLRINQKIREYLQGIPSWEEYFDTVTGNDKEYRLVYLVGKSFSCACKGSSNNSMFLTMAIDALSTVVIGFEIGMKDNYDTWIKMLSRMKTRGILPSTFMTNGSKHMEEAIQNVFPQSNLRIFYHKAYRDKELQCCLSRFPINNKLVNDAIKAYDTVQNQNLNRFLKRRYQKSLKGYILEKPEIFSKRLKERLDSRPKIRVEGLTSAFQTRFEKFHMLKDDPYPLINGWIAKWMTAPVLHGFSRLSFHTQLPSTINFKDFACGILPREFHLQDGSIELEAFIAEIAARSIHIPIFYSKCEMKIDKCSLF